MGMFDFLKPDEKKASARSKAASSAAAGRRKAVAEKEAARKAKVAAQKKARADKKATPKSTPASTRARIAEKEKVRKAKLAAQKKARADKKTTTTPKAAPKKQSQYANLDRGTKDKDGLTSGQKASTRKAVAFSKSTGSVKTKGGEFKTFAKGSKASGNFREAFALAKNKGVKTFTWNGKKYNTKTK